MPGGSFHLPTQLGHSIEMPFAEQDLLEAIGYLWVRSVWFSRGQRMYD